MYSKLSEIKNLKSFILINETLYTSSKNKVFFENKEIYNSIEDLQELKYNNSTVFINDIYGKKSIFLSNELKVFTHPTLSIVGDYCLTYKRVNEDKFTLVKKITDSEEFKIENTSTIFYVDSFLYIRKNFNNNLIESFKFPELFSLWQTDISQIGKYIPFPEEEEEEGEVKNFVGVYNNELIVQLTGGKFIGLDLENGKVNWEQDLVENNLTNQIIDYNFGDPYNPFLDEENGKIYILQGEVFIVFDLLTKKATYQWSSLNLPSEDYVFIRQSNINNNQIVFSAFRKGNIGNDDTIGIFDIQKNEIVWKHTFDFEKDNFIPNSNTNIQMSENRIGALDRKGNLYIFEREKNI